MPIVLNGTTGDISGSSLTGIDTGKILQVKQTVKTSLFSSSTNNSQVDVTGVNVSITPSSASNKILVICSGDYGNDNNDSLILNLTDDGMSYGMKYERLVPVLVNAIKELSAENTELKSRLDAAGL